MFLRCCVSNTAEQVATSFLIACDQYGCPSRVRTDHGMENFHLGLLMNILKGSNRGSIITGRSVHNQRIERLWRDVHAQVTSAFYSEFYSLEDAGDLIVDDVMHRCALQLAYLPVINQRLKLFTDAWNAHAIRTAHNCTPEQLWLTGMINCNDDGRLSVNQPKPSQVVFDYCQQYNNYVVDVNFINHDDHVRQALTVNGFNIHDEQLRTVEAALLAQNLRIRFLQCLSALRHVMNVA